MAKFIRVSEVCGNDVVKTVLINVDTIEHIKVGNKGTDTFIKLITPSPKLTDRTGWFFVKESLEQIEQQLFAHDYPDQIHNADTNQMMFLVK